MSEQDTGQERTEQPTPRRRRQARERGEVARSRELTTLAVTFVSALVLLVGGAWMGGELVRLVTHSLEALPARAAPGTALLPVLQQAVGRGVVLLLPLMVAVIVAAIGSGAAVGGFNFSAQALQPKFERINPVSGMKRLFSLQGGVEVLKAIAKFSVITGVALVVLITQSGRLMAVSFMDLSSALAAALQITAVGLVAMTAALALIAAVDVPFQLWQYQKKLRMTRQEVRDESKETEGRPEVRSRLRAAQREVAKRRMMAEVPRADVVVTNPTHYAVALRYDRETMRAPRVVAKGVDQVAMRIREVAGASGVTQLRAPALARTLWRTTDLGREVPADLYAAVAQIIAYVYQLRAARAAGEPEPAPPEMEG